MCGGFFLGGGGWLGRRHLNIYIFMYYTPSHFYPVNGQRIPVESMYLQLAWKTKRIMI